jgi:uncharacterized damage-inducible protein DinB
MQSAWKPWLEHTFAFGFSPDKAADFISHLAETPGRLAGLISAGGAKLTVRPASEKWSALEHAGHLLTTEQLWYIRFREFAEGKSELYPAEMSGRKTSEKHFNEMEPGKILEDFQRSREKMLEYLRGFKLEYFSRKALHPRLQQLITPVDLLYFIVEHDEHHLPVIRRLLH